MIKQSIFLITALLISSLCFTGCSDDDDDYLGNWVDRAGLDFDLRGHAVSFTIDNKVYIGTGYDVDDDEKFNDFYEIEFLTSGGLQIKQISDMPGVARDKAVAFSSDSKGYVGLGVNDSGDFLGDFYSYDPSTGTWETLENLPSGLTPRKDAVAFFVDGIGYVGSGKDEQRERSDFYSFDPSTGSWDQIATLNDPRTEAMSFVLDDGSGEHGYIVSGYYNGLLNDFWRYEPSTNEWIELNKISDYTDSSFDDDYDSYIMRRDGVAFTMGGKAYLATGTGSAQVWEWNPLTDRWKQKTDFEGTARYGAISFTINDIGYIATGRNSGASFNDCWYFEPYEEKETKD